MATKKELCGSTAEIVKNVPLVRVFFDFCDIRFRRVVAYNGQDVGFGVAKCELPKGHKGRHSTSKVTDFFKRIEW